MKREKRLRLFPRLKGAIGGRSAEAVPDRDNGTWDWNTNRPITTF
jgi:hypothetical protein